MIGNQAQRNLQSKALATPMQLGLDAKRAKKEAARLDYDRGIDFPADVSVAESISWHGGRHSLIAKSPALFIPCALLCLDP